MKQEPSLKNADLISEGNLENLNAHLIKENIPQPQRLLKLNEIAIQQMKLLSAYNYSHLLEHKKEPPEKRLIM